MTKEERFLKVQEEIADVLFKNNFSGLTGTVIDEGDRQVLVIGICQHASPFTRQVIDLVKPIVDRVCAYTGFCIQSFSGKEYKVKEV